jgi:hypothetical protein
VYLSVDGVRKIFRALGYEYRDDTAARGTSSTTTGARTCGSTLSFVTHAGVLAHLHPDGSWSPFLVALESDETFDLGRYSVTVPGTN